MNKNKSSKQQPQIPPTSYKFYLGSRERYIHIDAGFESGNIQLVRQMSQFNYRLSCIDDGVKTSHRVNSKSWFYFSVHGFPKNTKGKFAISRVQTLLAVYSQFPKSYRPVYRECTLGEENKPGLWSNWHRISTESPLVMRENGELQCSFEFLFKNENHKVEFAFAYPYTYSDNIRFLNSLNEYYCTQEFYFYKEVLTKSSQNRDIHLLTITSHDQQNKEQEEELLFNQKLFPEKCRPKRFKKPVILITARVHPGETAASFTMEGIINFLINSRDVRSFLLKKMFVFMIVPMINVDGVFHGHFRMDNFGKNLNRYYMDPDFESQPAIFAIKELASHLIQDSRLSFYFDLHAHNAKKGAFIYGNAINDFVEQVQSQVFCKLFALNNTGFEYEYCNFSLKQMNSKDRNEDRTKEGCGRVVMHRLANIIHSYSLQCGIISSIKNNIVPPPLNPDFQIEHRGLVEDSSQEGQGQPVFFTENSYRQLGKSLLVSILDVFDKNPYSRVYNSAHKSLEFLRRVTAFQVFHTAERFRMFEKYVYGKVKNINELIREVLNSKLHYRELYNFYFVNDHQLKNIQWPQNIPGLVKPKQHPKLKRFKSVQQPKLEYSLSFLNDLKVNKYQLQHEGSLPPEPTNPEELPEDELGSYSSETEDELRLKQLDEQYFQDILESEREPTTEMPKERSEVVHSWRTPGQSDSQDLLPNTQSLSQRENQSADQECCQRLSAKFKQMSEVKQIAKLKLIQNHEDYEDKQVKLTHNQSPSVRVRRLLKQDNGIKRARLTNEEMKDKLSELMAHQPIHLAHSGAFVTNASTISNQIALRGDQSPGNERQLRIFDQIKMEIKEQLRRHKDRKGIVCSTIKSNHNNKLIKSNLFEVRQKEKQKEKDRNKSTNLNFLNLNTQINLVHHKHKSQTLNRVPSKSSITKTQLPALNSHILIITSNSSKGLTHNQ